MNKILGKCLSLLKKVISKIAFSSDIFKKIILLAVGLLKFITGRNDEAKAYLRIAGFTWLGMETRSDLSSDYYNGAYYDTLEDENYEIYIESAKKLVLSTFPKKSDHLCDIGCGRGFLVRALKNEGYGKMQGIEISGYAVAHKVTETVYQKRFSDFDDDQFKVVSLINVLEHVKKEDIHIYLQNINRVTSDYVVACIPLYPQNLFNFFCHDTDHQIFECRAWWDAEFKKAGFLPCVLPSEPLPFIEPFVYKKIAAPVDKNSRQSRAEQNKIGTEIHFAIDTSFSNAFTWVTAKLAIALDDLGHRVSIDKAALPNTISPEDRVRLEQFMDSSSKKEVQIKWSHYWRPYLKRRLDGEINLEIFATNYYFNKSNKKNHDYWTKDALKNDYHKLPVSTFCRDVLIQAGVPEEKCFVLPHGYSPEIMTSKELYLIPTEKKFKLLSVTNAHDSNRYGIDLLLKAYGQAFTKDDDIVLVIKDYGGEDTAVQDSIARSKGGPHIIYLTQFLPKDTLIGLYKSCDAFVAPFRGEGFGMKILDAIACGMPAILPLFSGPRDYANAGSCCPVEYDIVPVSDCFDARNLKIGNDPHWCEVKISSLADRMRYVYEHRDEAKSLGQKDRDFVLGNYSWGNAAARLIEIIGAIRDKQ